MNPTRPDNQNSNQNDGTISNDNSFGGYNNNKKKTMVDGQEEMTSSENPKNQNVLVGFLVSFSKTEIGEFWELREGNNSIGSSQENQIFLAEKRVSAKHANINISKDSQNNCWKFQLVDLSSTNGTELNDNRLPIYAGQDIKNNDKIKIGEYTLVIFVADKFIHNLLKSEKFQSSIKVSYDSRDFNFTGDSTNANY